ncbi:hypothetical protein EYC80_001204 [Monilinia laxa]|uniref:Uncharacterized protein n=1 Tax=Monilinia laxa TaxID=61186 RepID=A0A5N6K8N9_MONLA|nr:hypothetical protein EYC80_001204 [Monilinia laxa]
MSSICFPSKECYLATRQTLHNPQRQCHFTQSLRLNLTRSPIRAGGYMVHPSIGRLFIHFPIVDERTRLGSRLNVLLRDCGIARFGVTIPAAIIHTAFDSAIVVDVFVVLCGSCSQRMRVGSILAFRKDVIGSESVSIGRYIGKVHVQQ